MDPVIARLAAFALVLTRISACFMVMPIFGSRSIPARVKVAAVVLLSMFFAMLNRPAVNLEALGALQVGLLLFNEALYGLAIGQIASLVFSAVKLGGRIAERQMGMAMAAVLDPFTGERTQPLGSLLEMIFVILFLSANGHHVLLAAIGRSYQAFPVGAVPSVGRLTAGVIQAGSVMMIAGLQLAAPMLAAFLLLMVVLAVLARVVPEMNIFFISLPMRAGMGLLMAVIFLPLTARFVAEFARWMGKLLPL